MSHVKSMEQNAFKYLSENFQTSADCLIVRIYLSYNRKIVQAQWL